MEETLLRNRLKRLLDNKLHIIAHESKGIHVGYIDTSIPSVAIIHYVSYLIGNIRSGDRHARTHESGEIRFYLEINVVGMRVIAPMARFRGHYTLKYIITCSLICMPERITGVGKCCGERIHRSIKAKTVEYVNKRKIHIHIVVKAGGVLIVPLDIMLRPFDRNVIGNHCAGVAEFGRSAIGTSDCLSGPSAFYFIKQNVF